jgi:hypothetical protein
MKKSLPNVTLFAYDNTINPQKTVKAINRCHEFFDFAETVMICTRYPQNNVQPIRFERVSTNTSGYRGAQVFEAHGIAQHVKTDFCLYVSHDGYVINPEAWTDEWFNYDFIGAPWPPEFCSNGDRVGNSGFCLQSKRFLDMCAAHRTYYPVGTNSDAWQCQTMRKKFEGLGIKYAPLDIAAAFSWEITVPEFPNGRPDAFGFHSLKIHPEYAL